MTSVLRCKALPDIGIPFTDEIRDDVICAIGRFRDIQKAGVKATFVCKELPPVNFMQKHSKHQFITVNQYKKLKRFKDGEVIIVLDKDLLDYKWWIRKCEQFPTLGYYVEDDELKLFAEKRRHGYCVICKWENRDRFQEIGFRNQFLFTDEEVDDVEHEFGFWEYPVIQSTKGNEVISIYGKNIARYFKVGDNSYDFVFERFIAPRFNKYMTGPSGSLYRFYMDQFDINSYHKVDYILSTYCKNRKMVRTSKNVKCLGNGSFNIALNIDEDVIRIHINYEVPFDEKGAKILMEETGTGFVPVKEIGNDYTITSLCKPITNRSPSKLKALFTKLRQFFTKHQDIGYVDYHWNNIMELNDEYVIIDIDLNMVYIKDLKKENKKLSELIGREQRTGYNPILYSALFREWKIEPTVYLITMLAIELFELVDYKTTFILTKEIVERLTVYNYIHG